MLDRLGLPRPQIPTKLYGVVALTLAVVYVLAGAAALFASRTEQAVVHLQEAGVHAALASASIELALEQQHRLVATAPFASDPAARDEAERAYRHLTESMAAMVAQLDHVPDRELAQRLASVVRQGEAALLLARDRNQERAGAAIGQYAADFEDLKRAVASVRQERARATRRGPR